MMINQRIEQAKMDGCWSAQIRDNLFGAYSPDHLLGVGHTELEAWADLFHDMDYGMGIVDEVTIRGTQQADAEQGEGACNIGTR